MTEHYLDNSATTAVSEKSAKKISQIINEIYGNPSSLHSKGIEAENELSNARCIIANSIGADDNEIIFTSGATEANNLAVFGAVNAKKRAGNKIVTTSVEHSSVIESIKHLELIGFEVIYLQPNENGVITQEMLENAIDKNTILVSIMFVNNEIGTKMPVDSIKKIITKKNCPALFHVDAVQAFGKIPVKAAKIGCDLLSVSAHKIHGPKGVGALYIKKNTHIMPLFFGGSQERGIRPGTEALPLICGFAQAVDEFDISSNYLHASQLKKYAKEKLLNLDGVYENSTSQSIPYILNISVLGIRSETMLHHLASMGVYISSGSACSKGKKSYVLSALKLPNNRIDSALRISFSKYSTKEDIDALVNGIDCGINKLVRKK